MAIATVTNEEAFVKPHGWDCGDADTIKQPHFKD